MKCPYCKQNLSDDIRICPGCGRGFEHLREFGVDIAGYTPTTTGKIKKNVRQEIESAKQRIPESPMNLQASLSMKEYLVRPFKDPEYSKKILTGSLLIMIPLAGQTLGLGYLLAYAHRIITRKKHDRLPDWRDWEDLMTKGLQAVAALMIYFFVYILINLLVLFPFMDSIITLPAGVYERGAQGFNPVLFAALLVPLTIVFFISLFFAVFIPILFMQYARNYQYEDFFGIKEAVLKISSNFLEFNILILALFIIWFPVIILSFPLLSFMPVLLFIILPFIIFTGMIITTSALGEFYHKVNDEPATDNQTECE
jgi:hypothetical protein